MALPLSVDEQNTDSISESTQKLHVHNGSEKSKHRNRSLRWEEALKIISSCSGLICLFFFQYLFHQKYLAGSVKPEGRGRERKQLAPFTVQYDSSYARREEESRTQLPPTNNSPGIHCMGLQRLEYTISRDYFNR